MAIHPNAVVSTSAQIGDDVTIGPFAVIEDEAVVGDRSVIDAAAQIRKRSKVGADCRIGSGALIGADPQFGGFDPDTPSWVEVGKENIIREYVTIHRSIDPEGTTTLGDGNFLMNGAHIGHDSQIGDHNTMANNVLVAGHVEVGNHCFFGGGSAYHQFVRIGDYVMAQGLAGMSLNIPPYVMVAAGINYVAGVNALGLRRAGFSAAARKEIKEAFRNLYLTTKSVDDVLAEAEGETFLPETEAFYQFLREKGKKPVCIRYRKGAGES
jgi:UDP-N-acetylglucosamine acyltransferase